MAVRRPEIAKYVEDGMGPGLTNPLGARAMYLFNEKGQDTLFRLHGTPEWASIGTAASSWLHPPDEPGRDRPLQPRPSGQDHLQGHRYPVS